ncbi:MAG: hypothetical protein ACKO0Z_02940 [Betaproteobacteria bacterium]
MALFLVHGRVVVRQYMADDDHHFNEHRLVDACGSAEAQELYERYWSAHTREYSVYYSAHVLDVTDVLTKEGVSHMVQSQRK